jgi:diguanylate cyclase (GGDEF)-like protein/PAS domain S-box-containing protein
MSTAHHIHYGSEAELRHMLLEYQAILDNASVGIVFTRNRTFFHCNERFAEMFGWPVDELIGQPTHIVYPSQEDYDRLGKIAIPVLSAGQRLDTELQMKRRDGTVVWCRMLANAVDPNDHSKGSIFIMEDISERKNADESSRQLLLEYRAILDNATLGITFTRKRIFLHCNARFSEMFGWGSNELIGQSASIVYPSDEAFGELSRKVRKALASGERFETELQMKRRDGSLFWCRMLARAIDPADSSKGSIFITEDVTERRAVQDALIRARNELEARVQERTAELADANMRLQQEIQERTQAEEQVRHLANHDPLTDLPNRRLLEDRLAHALAGAKRNGGQVAVLFIDLDYFKPINDSLGHRIGDLLLQAIAKRLRSLLREVDTVARVGGDEFVIVLPDVHTNDATGETAQRILDAMVCPYVIEDNELSVTPSMGISLYPNDGIDVGKLLDRADEAMYEAKHAGRRNFQFYRKAPETTAN